MQHLETKIHFFKKAVQNIYTILIKIQYHRDILNKSKKIDGIIKENKSVKICS